MAKYTYKDIVKEIEDVGYTLVSREEDIVNNKGFVLLKTRIIVKCPNSNHKEYDVSWDNFKGNKSKKGTRCPYCNNESIGERDRLSYEEVKTFIESVGYELISEEYKNAKTKIDIKCPKGHMINLTYDNFKNNPHCKKCSGVKKSEDQKLDIADVKSYIESYDYTLLSKDYINAHEKILVQCNKKHDAYEVSFNNFQQGYRCPYCKSSKGEEKIGNILKDMNVKYQIQYKFKNCKFYNCLPFDFYLPDYNVCIEFDGRQHFEAVECFGGIDGFIDTKIRDTIKNEYCKNNNIKLIRIPYWEFNNIEEILKNSLI